MKSGNGPLSRVSFHLKSLPTFSWRDKKVNLFLSLVGPDLDDGGPELEVGLVHLLGGAHLDAEVLPDQREEGRREVDHALVVNRLVHPDQLLEGQPVRTLGPEAQGRVHVLQHVVHLRVVDPTPEIQTRFKL